MSATVPYEQRLMFQINQDLVDPTRDPLSNSLYLLFLLENRIDSPEVGQLIDWSNSWVRKILVQKDYTQYIDRDFTSALVCRWALKKANRLSVTVPHDSLVKSFEEFLNIDNFFSNFGFTTLIVTSLYDDLRTDDSYGRAVDWVKKAIREKRVFNDPKNIVFSCLFLEVNNDQTLLVELADYAAWAAEQSAVSVYDKLYLGWVLWRLRSNVTRIGLPRIRELTQEALDSSTLLFQEPYVDEGAQELYGVPNRYRPSKFSLAVYLDLQRAFKHDTITISKEEMTKVGLLARTSGILATGAFLLVGAIGYFAYTCHWLTIGEFALSFDSITRIAANFIVIAAMMLLLCSGASLFYDGIIRSITIDQLIIANLKRRVTRYLLKIVFLVLTAAVGILVVGR